MYQYLDAFHPLMLAETIPLDVAIQQTKGGIDEKGRGPLPYPDACQAEAHSVKPSWLRRRQQLLVHGLIFEPPGQSEVDYVHLGR